jgi:predicted permease
MDATTAFAFIIGLLLLGRALGAAGVLPESTPDALNAVVLHVCLPASILLHASALDFSPAMARIAVVPWLLMGLSALLVLGAARIARWPEPTVGVLLLAIPLGNTAFLGYPLVAALLGEAALPYAVVYDQFGTFVMLSTAGLFVVARYGHGSPPGAAQILGRVLRFPPFIALIVALLLMPDRYPAPVEAVLRRLSDALLPLVGIAIGMQVRLRLPREALGPLAFGLAGKLLLLPAAALALAAGLGIEGAAREAVVLESAMPTMITAMALAATARLAPALGAALVGYGIVLSVALLPLWLWVLR